MHLGYYIIPNKNKYGKLEPTVYNLDKEYNYTVYEHDEYGYGIYSQINRDLSNQTKDS